MMMMGPRNVSPGWTLPRKRGVSVCGCVRLKVLFLALLCVLLGYTVICVFVQDIDTFPDTAELPYHVANHRPQRPQTTPHVPTLTESKLVHGPIGKWKDKLASLNPWKSNKWGKFSNYTPMKVPHGGHAPPSSHSPKPTSSAAPLHTTEEAELVETSPHRESKVSSKLKTNKHKILPNISETTILPDRPSLGERARIGKCTILFGNPSSVYERALRTHEQHDRLHNYPLHVLREVVIDDVWNKPAYILSLLLQEMAKPVGDRLDWLLWVDADTVILNPLIPVETFLPPEGDLNDIHMMVSHDWNGLNNGVFPVRVNPWAVELFTAIVAFRYYRPDADLTFRDQSAMAHLLKEPRFSKHVVQAPQRWFNAYQGEHNETLEPYQVRRGDFLVHFAGVGDRDERLRYWLERAEQHAPDWEIKVRHTSYPEEVKDFWTGIKAERKAGSALIEKARDDLSGFMSRARERMEKYEHVLNPEDVSEINMKLTMGSNLLDDAMLGHDIKALKDVYEQLEEVAQPLNLKAEEEHHSTLKEAHELVFEAEHSIFTDASSDDVEQQIERVQVDVDELKDAIVQPHWHAHDVLAIMDRLRVSKQTLDEFIQDAQQVEEPEDSDSLDTSDKQDNDGQDLDHAIEQDQKDGEEDLEKDEEEDQEEDPEDPEEETGRPEWDEDEQRLEDTGLLKR